ncbi:MAG: replication-associated recombination protein A [Actinobacteria bacterium]|nr:replication-associated recombination protein A [Actinomycetota bacterium]NBP53019.1 replication-associated recombination protein A [Actinomycetota bacterium]
MNEQLRRQAPLAARLRPRHIDEVVGQRHLVGPDGPLRALVETDRLTSVVFWGPPGTGKTTLAEVVAATTKAEFVRLSAVTSGVKDLREALGAARDRLGQHGRRTIVFIDEIHRFNTSQQDALLPAVEDGTIVLIGATTENPYFEVNAPLLSRSTLFRLEPLSREDLAVLVARGLDAEGMSIDPLALAHLLSVAQGDGRQILTSLEVACALARSRTKETDTALVAVADVEAAISSSALRYGRDDHYDVVSAFIKSVRGSSVDAAIHWLARMLVAGEDPRFIARRLVILASEDIGMADPTSLVVATACAQAVDFVGMPEAQLNLAQATIHLCLAPKSNSTSMAIWTAMDDVRRGDIGAVPTFLRDAHYSGAEKLGHGTGYVSPHVASSDNPSAKARDYLPDELRDRTYYRD